MIFFFVLFDNFFVSAKHGSSLQRFLAELEHLQIKDADFPTKVRDINERATLFRITTNAMINVISRNLCRF